MKRAITTLFAFLFFVCCFAQKQIDFIDFYQGFEWGWTRSSISAQFQGNVSGTADSLSLSNVVLGKYCGDMYLAFKEDSDTPFVFRYDFPKEHFDEVAEVLFDKLGEPVSNKEDNGNTAIVWVNDTKILMLINISDTCAVTCLSPEAWDLVTQTSEKAQNPEHLKFKGVPIDGTPEAFVQELLSLGFKDYTEYNGTRIVEGPFAGFNKTRVYVTSTNNTVYNVAAYIDFSDSWQEVKSSYLRLKDSLSKKYGVTPDSDERFPEFPSEGSGYEYRAFLNNTAHYESDFNVPQGIIRLVIVRLEAGDGFSILISYYDRANSLLFYDNAEADL